MANEPDRISAKDIISLMEIVLRPFHNFTETTKDFLLGPILWSKGNRKAEEAINSNIDNMEIPWWYKFRYFVYIVIKMSTYMVLPVIFTMHMMKLLGWIE